MITKIKSSKAAALKLSMGVIATAALLLVFACENKKPVQNNIAAAKQTETIVNEEQKSPQADNEETFLVVEQQATFQGGDVNAFRDWVTKNLTYPDIAIKKGISGKVYVQYAVNSKGYVVDVKVVRGVDPSLDKEAVRVISSSPKWEPAKQRGQKVKEQFTIPIAFQLK